MWLRLLCFGVLLNACPAFAQNNSVFNTVSGKPPIEQKVGTFNFNSDKPSTYWRSHPFLTAKGHSSTFLSTTYWLDRITTQSFNHGKLGTFYYWDLQGNLRESRFFIDVAGRNKRGLKLVFPRR